MGVCFPFQEKQGELLGETERQQMWSCYLIKSRKRKCYSFIYHKIRGPLQNSTPVCLILAMAGRG